MKRVFSLILAVVMVALMIPFAAIVTSATDESSSEIILPENWRMSADDGTGVVNSQNELGVTLGSAGQYVQMTTKEGVGIGQKRVLAIDFGIPTKVNVLRISWEPTAETAQEYSWHNGSDIDFVFQCGPGQSLSENSFSCVKFCTGTGYTWNNSTIDGQTRKTDFTVTKLVDGERVTTTSAGQSSWYAKNNTDADLVAMDGAMNGNGSKMVFYFEIDENNKITYVHQVYTYHDAEGNFVSETVLTNRVNLDNVVVCDGYLTIGHTGWGGNTSIAVKSVDVYAGTYAEMGKSLYSANFGTPAEPELVAPSLTLDLPEGWVITNDNAAGVHNSIDAKGLALGSAGQAIAMTDKVGVGQKRVITVDYGIINKLSLLHFNWVTETPVAGTTLQNSNTAAPGTNDLFLCVLGGPLSPVTDGASFGWKSAATATTGSWLNAQSNATGYYRTTADGEFATATVRRWTIGNNKGNPDNTWGTSMKALYDGALGTNGTKMTVYIELDENNFITGAYTHTIYFDAEGNFVRENVVYTENNNAYKASCDGYLTIGHTGGGNDDVLVIKSVRINAGTAKEMGEELHSADFAAYGAENSQTIDVEAYKDYMYTVTENTELVKGEVSYRNEADVEGIRFTTTLDAADLQTLVDLQEAGFVTKVEMGTLITTAAWADAAGAVTFEALDAIKGDKNAYVEVMATIGDFYDVDTFAGTITEVNAEREYCAVGFARVTLVNGEVVVVYSDVNTATLADVKPAA